MAEEKQKPGGRFGCQDFDENLAAYLEGEENARVRMHAEQCLSCGSLLDDLRLIRVAANDLPLETPSPRVWSNIRGALVEEGLIRQQESFWGKWISSASLVPRSAPAAALAFALLLAVMIVFKGDFMRNESRNTAQTPAASSAAPVGLPGVQSNLVSTVRAMEENYKARESSLDPSARQVYEAGLNSLDNSIQECLDSLQKQPHNILVREYLMHAYAQKAEVLASALEYGGR